MLRLTQTGAQGGERRLRLLSRRLGDLRLALRNVSELFTHEERALFAGHRGALRPLKASTVERKRRDPNGRIRANATDPLVARGFLKDFLTSPHKPVRLARTSVQLGIPDSRRDLAYARDQARSDRNPVIDSRVIARESPGVISDYLFGR